MLLDLKIVKNRDFLSCNKMYRVVLMLFWIVPHNMVVSHIFLKAILIKVM